MTDTPPKKPGLPFRDAAGFAAALPDGGRMMGIDLGTRTIGIAFCDAGWQFASPHQTLPRGKFNADLTALKALVGAQHIKGIVIGHPINMDGSDSARAQASRAFARNLAPLALPVLLWDERMSTQAVERTMIEADMSRAKRAERIDALAAAHILQSAIDALAYQLPSATSEAREQP